MQKIDGNIPGYYEYKGKLSGNSVIGSQHGPNVITFNDGTKITYMLPPQLRINGLLFGARIIEWFGKIQFHDEKNNLSADIEFYEPKSFFSKSEHSSDYFE